MVSETLLLQGSWYALEQAGRLAAAAVQLYDSGDPATGVVLAMFTHEELGRSRILRQLGHEVAGGGRLTAVDVRRRCNDHLEKHREGALSVTQRIDPSSRLAPAAHAMSSSPVGSAEWKNARAILDEAVAADFESAPKRRHGERMAALYVDLRPQDLVWLRPRAIDSQKARELIEDAVNDYAHERDRLRDEVIEVDFPQMALAYKAMNPAPLLSTPIWPKEALSNREHPLQVSGDIVNTRPAETKPR